ncbi:ATP-dependent RNA helicase [Bonamia ostreae]|uniref:ATP-dependent RNA helicase n=1 Tax=Bonamia ostreae TaxID=126728 RepID=A0ABV2AQC8_9EUKA
MKSQSHLPIFKNKNEIIAKIQKSQCTIIVSETGSGKTTQIPQFLYEKGLSSNGIIAITQPRRVAAVTVASRVASEMKSALGEKVGYKIRFEDTTSSQTKIQFMTDGMLVRDYMADSSLKKYSVVIIDEAHERTLNTEILFALIKKLMEKRKDLKIIIMSATLSIDKFAKFITKILSFCK